MTVLQFNSYSYLIVSYEEAETCICAGGLKIFHIFGVFIKLIFNLQEKK